LNLDAPRQQTSGQPTQGVLRRSLEGAHALPGSSSPALWRAATEGRSGDVEQDDRGVVRAGQKAPRFIETRPRRGYRFVAPVTDESGTLPAPASAPQGRTSAFQTQWLAKIPIEPERAAG
jgi:hypothetical protein